MLPVIYSMSVSLDGVTAGPHDDIRWTAPDPELTRFRDDQTRQVCAHVCGRRMYERMRATPARPVPTVVFSRTLNTVRGNARLATADLATELNRLCDGPGEGVVALGGAQLSAAAVTADLIDEYRLFVCPVTVGAGASNFPPLPQSLDLQLLESRTFDSHVVYLRYRRVR
ncbi:dihydrofolate reductase family protein [Nocardia sp. NPDC003693]